MTPFCTRSLILLVLAVTFLKAQSQSDSVQSIVNDLLAEIHYDGNELVNSYLVSDLPDRFSGKVILDTLGCTVFPIYIPGEGLRFDEKELTEFLAMEKSELDFSAFIRDHDVTHSISRVHCDASGNIRKIQKLNPEYNDDFGTVLTTSYYLNGRLALIVNDYCLEKRNLLVVHKFTWAADLKSISEIKTITY